MSAGPPGGASTAEASAPSPDKTSPGPASGRLNGSSGDSPDASSEEITTPAAVIGEPQVGTVTIKGGSFRSKRDGPTDVETTVRVTPNGSKLIGFTSKFAIDADGAGGAWKKDKTGQSKTALTYKDGGSLNPSALPYISLPMDFHSTHPGVKLGDYAAVTYGAKTLYAIVGDAGPEGVIGEGSMALASGLGINPDPNHGGISRKDVRYVIVPGSRDPEPARDAATIQKRGKAIFDAAAAPVK